MSLKFYLILIIILALIFAIALWISKKRKQMKEMKKIEYTLNSMKILFQSFQVCMHINILDFKDSNYFNEISIKFTGNEFFNINKLRINKNSIKIPIILLKNKKIYEAEISLTNSITNISRTFKISINQYFTNNINIYLNNETNKYYCSDIIFYGEINKIKLEDKFKLNSYNIRKRLRCAILNIDQNKLFEIIRNNNEYNSQLNSKIAQVLSNNSSKNLLINILIGNVNSNVLIFAEEKKKVITATKEEKKMFSEFYQNIMKSINDEKIINEISESFIDKLILKKILFGSNIDTTSQNSVCDIINSFLNQGINYLFDNNIIEEKDKEFIFGCLIVLLFKHKNQNKIKKSNIKIFKSIIDEMEENEFDNFEQIRAGISYITFFLTNPVLFTLEITKNLNDDNPFKKGFNFYRSIIEDLSEESELMLIFLQLNSGSGKELINNKNCYKISMIPISEIKEHLINNIPKYFFYYNHKGGENIAVSDSITQILAFNKEEIFSENTNINNIHNNDNRIMNVTISMFHEGGHQKFHMDFKTGYNVEPLLFINKNYKLISQEILNLLNGNSNNIKGESGMCIDYYLYNFFLYPAQIIIRSSQSYKIMDKKFFTGKLDELNKIAIEIINNYLKNNKISIKNPSGEDDRDALINIVKILKKDDKDNLDDKYIIIGGKKYFCGLGVNY